jgi:hypothetical protein
MVKGRTARCGVVVRFGPGQRARTALFHALRPSVLRGKSLRDPRRLGSLSARTSTARDARSGAGGVWASGQVPSVSQPATAG